MTSFDLQLYEHHVYTRQYELAARDLLTLLQTFDAHLGQMGADFQAAPTGVALDSNMAEQHLLARMASATLCMFSDPQFQLSYQGIGPLFVWHRWLCSLFAASPLLNADAVLRAISTNRDDPTRIEIRAEDIHKFCLLYSGESRLPLDMDALWDKSPKLALSLGLTLLAPRFSGSPDAHAKRELLLPWLTRKLESVDSLADLPIDILHDAYMHCSYADRPDKHDIKKSINRLVAHQIKQWGLGRPCPSVDLPAAPVKPVMLVVLEWFQSTHAMFRCHSLAIEGARECFHVIAIGNSLIDEPARNIFDEFITMPDGLLLKDQLSFIRDMALRHAPHVLYMPSVGMWLLTVFVSNMRLAPVQACSLGHPATTHASCIDLMVAESDCLGDPACFSETLLALPPGSIPFRPSPLGPVEPQAPTPPHTEPALAPQPHKVSPEKVQVAITTSSMKLNPEFLLALRHIGEQAGALGTPVHFHLLVGMAMGTVYIQICRVVRQFLGDIATVYPPQHYGPYMQTLRRCDMFLNPFPFGNTNGIVDTVSAGLVGVCRTGPEAHAHIDDGLFHRLGFPEWTVAQTTEQYIAAAVRLITRRDERQDLSAELTGPEQVARVFFRGTPQVFGQMLLARLTSVADEVQ